MEAVEKYKRIYRIISNLQWFEDIDLFALSQVQISRFRVLDIQAYETLLPKLSVIVTSKSLIPIL